MEALNSRMSRRQQIQYLKQEIVRLTNELYNAKQISKFVSNHITNRVAGFRNNQHLKKLQPYHQQATILRANPNDKVKKIDQFLKYKPSMVNVVFQVYVLDSGNKLRLSQAKHSVNKRNLDPQFYINLDPRKYETRYNYENDAFDQEKYGNYIGEKRWRDMVMPQNFIVSYPKKKEDIYQSGQRLYERDCVGIGNGEVREFCNALVATQRSAALFTNSLYQIMESKEVILVIEKIERTDINLENIPIPKEEQLTNGCYRMCHKNLVYDINPLAQTFGELFVDKGKYRGYFSCFADAILNTWATEYNAYYKRKKLTYERIAKIIGKEYDETKPFPMSWNEACLVFKELGVRAKMYNEERILEATYHPEMDGVKLNTNMRKTLNIIRKGAHAYEIENPDIKASLSLKHFDEPTKITVGDKYQQSKKFIDKYGVAHTLGDIVKHLIDHISDEESVVSLIWLGGDLKGLLWHLIERQNYVPHITCSQSGEITSLSIRVNTALVTLSIPNVSLDTIKDEAFDNMTNEQALEYDKLRTKSNIKFTHPKYKSYYTENFLNIMQTYKRAALCQSFRKYEGRVIGLDFARYYPFIVHREEKFPIYYGDFQMYDGHTVNEKEEYTKYLVRRIGEAKCVSEYIVLNQEYDIIHGFNVLKFIDKVEIIGFIRPYKFVTNDLKDILEETLSSDILPTPIMKNIQLTSIGKWGKTKNSKEKFNIFTKESDAATHIKKMQKIAECSIKIIGKDDVVDESGITDHLKKLYLVKTYNMKNMVDGFIALHHLVYDRSRFYMSILAKELEKKNIEIIGINTDNLMVKEEDGMKMKFEWKDKSRKMNVNELGSIRREYSQLPGDARISTVEFDKKLIQAKIDPSVYVLQDEYDNTEAFKRMDLVLRLKKRIMIKADHAGSGKSHMCLAYLIHKILKPLMKIENDKNIVKGKFAVEHIIACPQNAQAFEIQNQTVQELNDKGFNATTTYMLCGKVLNDDGNIDNGNKTYGYNFKIVVLEEVGQYTVEEWIMMKEYMSKCKNTLFIANGDINQCEPVEEDMNPYMDVDEFYNNIINSVFDTHIMLKEPKRYATEELKKKAMKMKDELIDKKVDQIAVMKGFAQKIELHNIPDNAICISYKQDTRRALNEFMHKKINGDGARYYKGLILRANNRKWIPEKKFRVQKNYDFEVVEVREKSMKLKEILSGLEFDIHECDYKMFSLPYAFTGHSQQGRSVTNPIVIFDYDFHHVTRKWLYVALTRNRNLEVYYCDHQFVKNMDKEDIKDKIESYKQQDMRANRGIAGDYINVNWYFLQSIKQKHKCYICQEVMNLRNIYGDSLNHTADRLDNALPHTKTNCKLCCLKCNISKH